MEEIQNFILGLKEREIKKVALDIGYKVYYIYVENLLHQVEKNFKVAEICDTYYEDISYISKDGKFIEIHALY